MKDSKGSFLEKFQLTVFTINYILACILLFWLLSLVFVHLSILAIALISLVFLLLATVIWAHLYIIFSIPQRLAGSFDFIKNNIARGKLIGVEEFSEQIANFLTDFYNYSFFDIAFSAFKIKGHTLVFSNDVISTSLNWDKVEKEARTEDYILDHGKHALNRKNYYAYTIPVYFGDDYLGFFTVFSLQRLGRLRLRLLSDLEDHFIDDQLVHILNKKNN